MTILNKDQQIMLVRKFGRKIAQTSSQEVWEVEGITVVMPIEKPVVVEFRVHHFEKKVGVQFYKNGRRISKLPAEIWEIVRPYGRFVKKLGLLLITPNKEQELRADLERLGVKYSPIPVKLT